jgi:hypothetical protein
MHRPAMSRLLPAAFLVVALALAGCVTDSRPDASACAADSVELELTLTANALDPSDPAVCRGQRVTMVVHAETDGVIHLHGYDEQVGATPVSAGEDTTLEFTAATSGQFPIELHAADDPRGVEVGIFTVHEP